MTGLHWPSNDRVLNVQSAAKQELKLGGLVRYPLVLLVIELSLQACVSSTPFVSFGVASVHAGYVPARTAVLPCRLWPESARFESLPLSNMPPSELQKICQSFDEFVLKGFEDQPYMRGYSPAAVQKLLSATESFSNNLTKIDSLWRHITSDCAKCRNAPSFYTHSIAERTDWRLWLVDLSNGVRFADAVLMPFITFGTQYRYDDRGIATAKRAVGSVLLLIETSTGDLIWSSGREASALNQSLAVNHQLKEIEYPDWEQVYERAFQNDLWTDFPGRQEYQ